MANLITFDGLSLPNGSIKPSPKTIEQIKESEAGTDIGNVVRFNKLTLNCSVTCTGRMKDLILAKSRKVDGMCTFDDRTFKARLRVNDYPYIEDSDQIAEVGCLWTVNFSIYEE